MSIAEASKAEQPIAGREERISFEPQPLGLLDRMARRAIVARLEDLRGGSITLRDADGAVHVGQAEASDSSYERAADRETLRAEVRVVRGRFYRQALFGGSLAVAESYLDGDWECDRLADLVRILLRDLAAADRLEGRFARWVQFGNRIYHRLRSNTRSGSRKNIHAHYDVGNDFFQLILDETLAYSSGIFLSPNDDLRAASVEKMDRICRKLDLGPSDHVIEIGSGWGGFALHAAENYGCRITTTTISERQYELAQRRISDAGLTERITILKNDYRDLPRVLGEGGFDKLVSVEMLEAVGHRYYNSFFDVCSRLLKPAGSMLLQTIVIPDRVYDRYLNSVDFIQRYVFPGGCLPALGALFAAAGRASDLRFVHAEDFGSHYARTLSLWRERFFDRLDEVRALGYDDYFIRLWNYYLCYCEAAFEERYIGVVQMQFDKPRCRSDSLGIGARAAGTSFGRGGAMSCEAESER